MSLSSSRSTVAAIKAWLKNKLTPLAQELDNSSLVESAHERLAVLEAQEKVSEASYSVCLLGQAGVGKSTLLNTLVAGSDIVVPSGGGTGPLTANALKVSFSEQKSFKVKYHGKVKINQLRFVLDGIVQRDTTHIAEASDQITAGEEQSPELSDETSLDSRDDTKTKSEAALRTARLLVCGDQTADRTAEYLADALRVILDNETKYESELLEEDIKRIDQVVETLYLAEDQEFTEFSGDDSEFRSILYDHACGFLSPLIAELEISWPSEVLRSGIEIVDLPGIGIVSDVYSKVTANYLRKEAQSVMLVADSRGLREEDALLLRDSGFLVRLMHSLDDPQSDPVRLIVVVVRVDDVATENWRNDKSKNGKALATKAQHFEKVAQNCRQNVRKQLVDYIQKIWLSEDTEGNIAKQTVIERLSECLEVHPVSALQYRLIIDEDEDEEEVPFIKDVQHTNIPALRRELIEAASDQQYLLKERFSEGRKLFFERIKSQLNTEVARREEGENSAELRHLKDEFEVFTNDLNLEYNNRLGEFRNYLRNTVPGQISDKVEIASGRAEREIRHYLGSMRSAHWGTLRAAVRRKGSFQGARNINLPQDFALRFEEPLAEIWSKEILQKLRSETRKFTKFRSNALEKIDSWVKERDVTPPLLLSAVLNDLTIRQQELESSEGDAVEDLRARVRKNLQEKIEEPIRENCTKFVDAHQDIGSGVKQRILELFDELAHIGVEAAKEPAHELLTEQFKIAEEKLLKDLKESQNPIEQVLGAFKESDDSLFVEKGPTVDDIRAVIETMPVDLLTNEGSHASGQI